MRDGTNTRKKLERCALTLFVQKGITATTIKDIAQEADVAEGTLYRHYKSKEELAQSLFTNAYEEVAESVIKLLSEEDTLEKKIRAMVGYFSQKYDDDPILFNYLLLVQHTQIKTIASQRHSAHTILVEVFKGPVERKEVARSDANICASIVLGIVLQAAVSRVYNRILRPMTSDVDELVSAIMGALKER